MKLGAPVKVYTASPTEAKQGKPFMFSKQLLVKEVIPIAGDTTLISSAIARGDPLYFNRLLSAPQLRARQPETALGTTTESVPLAPEQSQEAAPTVTATSSSGPQIATMAQTLDDVKAATPGSPPTSPLREMIVRATSAPGAFEISKETFHVLKVTNATTHADLVKNLQIVGVSSSHADSTANFILEFIKSHGCSSLLIGVGVGGAVAALVGFFRPKTPLSTLAAIGTTTAVIAGLLFYFLVPATNPFVGEWQMTTADSRYAVGKVPSAAKTIISEDGKSLRIDQNATDSDGRSQQLNYAIYPDGKDHPAVGIPGVDTTYTILTKNKLTTLFKLNGHSVRTEERVISSDQKKMTDTVALSQPDGRELKNVSVYEQK